MEYFDFHVHAFVDSLAERAVAKLSSTSGIMPYTDGTVKGIHAIMEKNEISKALLLPVATKPSQQKTINTWAADVMIDNLYCCGTIHPDAEDFADEIERIKALGLCGIKFHSEYQKFKPNEERVFPIYSKIAEAGLPVVFHGGWDPVSEDEILATPKRFAVVAEKFPQLTMVIAHLGGMNLWDDVERFIAGRFENVYLDVSMIAGYIELPQLLRIIKLHGADKILFGSDCPWSDPAAEIDMIESLPISDAEKESIFYKNAEELLALRKL